MATWGGLAPGHPETASPSDDKSGTRSDLSAAARAFERRRIPPEGCLAPFYPVNRGAEISPVYNDS